MNTSLITQLRDRKKAMRLLAVAVLVSFFTVIHSPAVYAMVHYSDNVIEKPKTPKKLDGKHVFSDLANTVKSIEGVIESAQKKALPDLKHDINKALVSLEVLDQRINHYFKKMPNNQLMHEKHKQYKEDMHALQQQLTQWDKIHAYDDNVKDKIAHQQYALSTLLDKLTPKVKPKIYDNFTPFGSRDATPRLPATNDAELAARLGVELLELPDDSDTPPALPEPSATPTELDLQFTTNAPNSDVIVNKAAELNNDPLAIYHWVYNHIEFIPSFGAIQGGEQTLLIEAGNATDTASLLVALLRASDYPARYKFGTVRLPIKAVENWVGGVEVPLAAANLLSQGGIPSILRSVGERIEFVDMEHTWVEVYIDGQWVELDASFKQYNFQQGINIEEEVPFDVDTLLIQLDEASTVAEGEGSLQGFPQTIIDTSVAEYQQAVEQYLLDQHPDVTFESIVGIKSIIPIDYAAFPELSYSEQLLSMALSDVPENLAHLFRFDMLDIQGNVLMSSTHSTSSLAGKRLSAAFRPATAGDEQFLLNFLPANYTSFAEIPNTFPAGAFNVIAEFSINDVVQSVTAPLSFGQELQTKKGFWNEYDEWLETTSPIITGEHQAIGIDLQGVSEAYLLDIQTSLSEKLSQLEQSDFTHVGSHQVLSDLLQSGVAHYMAMTKSVGNWLAQRRDVVFYRQPSYGTFSSTASINYSFGEPISVTVGGMLMDMDRISASAECKMNCWSHWVDFNRQEGIILSAYEHLIPELLFSDEENTVTAVSAVKALQLALNQGQKLWFIDDSNINIALDEINFDAAIEDEILAAVSQGMEVTAHTDYITAGNILTAGYIIVDPNTGAGAYRIASGANGGIVSIQQEVVDAFNILGSILGPGLTILQEIFDNIEGASGGLFEFLGKFVNRMSLALNVANSYRVCENFKLFVTSLLPSIIGAALLAAVGPLGLALATIPKLAVGLIVGRAVSEVHNEILTECRLKRGSP